MCWSGEEAGRLNNKLRCDFVRYSDGFHYIFYHRLNGYLLQGTDRQSVSLSVSVRLSLALRIELGKEGSVELVGFLVAISC